MAVLDRARGELAYRRALRNPGLEARDVHEADEAYSQSLRLGPRAAWMSAVSSPEGTSVVGNGKKLKQIRGMGTVYDWRDSPWTPANGGRIKPTVFVQHIPVVPNTVGIGDFVTLRNVLVAQGLMVQSATDREGNVGLFTPFDSLCFQARGANQQSCGCENMHASTSEGWTKKQLRAAAWVVQLAKRKHGIPAAEGRLGSGSGVVRVLKRGQITHMDVSNKAGFHDRSDPGAGYDFEYVRHCVVFFDQHGHMEGA